ncbi:MAG: CvpA family protein [Chitinispirillia bacterium]|nr:CvpA family protein [Chitinispirillia bacterium]MCL2268383.1 CvpA family protein [Chitinispirillia bacterium]
MSTVLDVVILAVAVVLAIWGAMNGLIRGVFRLAAMLAGFFAAWMYYGDVQNYLVSATSSGSGNSAAITAFLIVFIAVSVVVLGIGHLLYKFVKAVELGWLDRLGGIALGLTKAGIIAWAACLSISSMPEKMINDKFDKSTVYKTYGKMPQFFSLGSMLDWRDGIRGFKPDRGDDDGNGGTIIEDGGSDSGGEFDSPLKKNMDKKNKKGKAKTVDI